MGVLRNTAPIGVDVGIAGLAAGRLIFGGAVAVCAGGRSYIGRELAQRNIFAAAGGAGLAAAGNAQTGTAADLFAGGTAVFTIADRPFIKFIALAAVNALFAAAGAFA